MNTTTADRRGPRSEAAARVCRHCRQGTVSRPRKLCRRCFYDTGVRDLYPPKVRYGLAADEPGEVRATVAPPPDPTPHRPGTAGKVAALEARAAAGFALWHAGDAPAED